MTYAQGGLIQASDYNGFASNINSVWNALYGQPAISAVAVGDRLQAQQWNSIYTSIANAAGHQGTTVTAIPAATVGGKITYYPQLPTNISAIIANAYNCGASGTDTVGTGTRSTQWGSGVGIPTVTSTATMSFPTANEMRYFFNAGGRFRINTSRSGGSATGDNTAWTDLCTGIGRLAMPALSTAQTLTGSSFNGLTQFANTLTPTVLIARGAYDLTSTPQELFRQVGGSGVYTSDVISISYSATHTSVTATVSFTDTNSGYGGVVDGDLSVFCVARPGESTFIANTWGTPTITVTAPQ
jgi:hypothetical protein